MPLQSKWSAGSPTKSDGDPTVASSPPQNTPNKTSRRYVNNRRQPPMMRFFPPLIRYLTVLLVTAASPYTSAAPAVSADAPENKIAPESEKSIRPAKPEPLVKKISPSTYQIGRILINKETRKITLPASTKITDPDSIIEYLLVHENGEKVHETLLVTPAEPTHVNIALKLLNYKESLELFPIIKEDGTPTDKYPDVPDEIKKAARFTIQVTWKDGQKEKTLPAT
ncbi:MAG: hypothetical protein KJO79_05245, partial [Verrucomicrobiae bacterium]|nr:hypothetical protein [Verrucomicrobiae bacterium]NNJ86565.1 hypothetical protein [Akkermansiaceae bacterium]